MGGGRAGGGAQRPGGGGGQAAATAPQCPAQAPAAAPARDAPLRDPARPFALGLPPGGRPGLQRAPHHLAGESDGRGPAGRSRVRDLVLAVHPGPRSPTCPTLESGGLAWVTPSCRGGFQQGSAAPPPFPPGLPALLLGGESPPRVRTPTLPLASFRGKHWAGRGPRRNGPGVWIALRRPRNSP